MKHQPTTPFGKLILAGMAIFSLSMLACLEDDDFDNFRPVDFFITATALSVEQGKTITFQDSSNNASSRVWMFPGGSPEMSTEASPTVRFDTVGTYDVSVITTFTDGNTKKRTLEINVLPGITAGFTASATEALPGTTITFTNTTEGVGNIPPEMIDSAVLYKWVFEGISDDTIIANNPSVVYDELGTFDVFLTVERRSTGSVSRLVREDYIEIVSALRIRPDKVEFNEEGSVLSVHFGEPLSPPEPTDLAKLSLKAADGTAVTVNSVTANGNILELGIDPSALTEDETYRLSYSGGSLGFQSGAIVDDLSDLAVTYYGPYEWLTVDYSSPNGTRDVVVGGSTFEWTTSDLRGGFKANGGISLLNPGEPEYFILTSETGPLAATLQVTPKDGAGYDDIRAIALEMYNLGPNGTTYTFSHPVRIHQTSTPDFPDDPLDVSLNEDGTVLTINSSPGRLPKVRMVVLLDNVADAANFTMASTAAEPTLIYFTPSGY